MIKPEDYIYNQKLESYNKGWNEAIEKFCKFIDKHSHDCIDGICLDDDITILAEQFLKGGNI